MKIYILLALLGLIGFTECKVGKKCTMTSACSSDTSFSAITGRPEECKDGVCQCKPGADVEYNGSLEPDCENELRLLDIVYGVCNETSCRENAECRLSTNNDSTSLTRDKKKCFCKEGYIHVKDECLLASPQKVLERCYISNNTAYLCDMEEKSICSRGKCICFHNYFANTTSEKCEPVKNYMDFYNLTEYRVKPNEYCSSTESCILGLSCSSSFKCECPRPCTYNTTAEGCDCGIITYAAPVGPIVLGVLLGIVIMGFWCYMINRTYHKFEAKREAGFQNFSSVYQSSPTHGTYAPNPVSPITASSGVSSPPVGLTSPSANGDGRQSPMGNNSYPRPAGDGSTDPLAPPHPSQYGLNPHIGTETPSVMDDPPPYSSVNPPSNPNYSTSPLPYSVSPSALPYPSSTSDLPYSSSPSSYPVSPSAPYPANTTTAPSSDMPKQEPEKSVPPPSYNPSYP